MLIIDETSNALLSGIVGGFVRVDHFKLGFRFVLCFARAFRISLAFALRRAFPNRS